MIFIITITFLYLLLIGWLLVGFHKVKVFKITNKLPDSNFSIIIPFRNEAENLPDLLSSLEAINYPKDKFEVLFINDDSTDNSVLILEKYLVKNKHFKLLNNQRKSNSPKKDAINTAINIAKYNWIITTDADCEVPKNWLQCFNEFINSNLNKHSTFSSIREELELGMLVAPVVYKTNKSFLQNFQNMDFLSLIGSTIGGFGIQRPFLCNGANLCYKKAVFLKVNGFNGNDDIASGDDIFLMEKFLEQNKNSVKYLKSKDAIVITKPETTFKGLLSQRIRWASKTGATKNWFGKLVGLLVFLMNFLLVFGFWFLVWSFFTQNSQISQICVVFLLLFLLKFNIDFLLIQKTYKFMGLKNGLKPYIFSSVLYPFFVVLVVILSFFKKYEWKDRRFKA